MCLVHVFIFVRKAEHMYEMRAQRGEERWDESTVRRGDKIKKKADQWIRAQSKKFIIEFKNCCSKRCENCSLKSVIEIHVFCVYKTKKNVFGIMV